MKIEIGPMCKPLNEQLGGRLSKTDSVLLERDHRDISRLYVRGYLSDSAFSVCGKRLIKRVEQAIANNPTQTQLDFGQPVTESKECFSIFDSSNFKEILNTYRNMLKKYVGSDISNPQSWNGGGVRTYPVGAFITAILSGKIAPYNNNRGTGVVSKETAKKVFNTFCHDFLGQFVIGLNKNKLSIADGNSRAQALISLLIDGKLTSSGLEREIPVQYISSANFLKTYAAYNSTKPHKGIEKLMNPDYFFGKVFQQLKEDMGENWDYLGGGSKFCQQAAYLVLWFYDNQTNGYKNLSYDNIFAVRRTVKQLELMSVSQSPYKIDDIPFDDLCKGFDFYVSLRKEISKIGENASLDKKAAKKICGSGPFMSLIVAEIASGRCSFGNSYLRLAKRIVCNSADLSNLACCLTHSGSVSTNTTEMEIRKILTP